MCVCASFQPFYVAVTSHSRNAYNCTRKSNAAAVARVHFELSVTADGGAAARTSVWSPKCTHTQTHTRGQTHMKMATMTTGNDEPIRRSRPFCHTKCAREFQAFARSHILIYANCECIFLPCLVCSPPDFSRRHHRRTVVIVTAANRILLCTWLGSGPSFLCVQIAEGGKRVRKVPATHFSFFASPSFRMV